MPIADDEEPSFGDDEAASESAPGPVVSGRVVPEGGVVLDLPAETLESLKEMAAKHKLEVGELVSDIVNGYLKYR